MSNNSILVKKLFKVENISVSPFCTKLSQCTSFFLNASVLFLSTKIFVQNPGIKLVHIAKYIRQTCKLTHITSKRNPANWEFLSLKNCFVSSFSSRKRRKNSLSRQVSYFCMEKMFMMRIHTFTQCFRSGVQGSTSNFIDNFHRLI